MIAVAAVLLAVPLGWLCRSSSFAAGAYAIAYLWAFTFQTLDLLLDSLGGASSPAFTEGEFPTSYGAVSMAVFLAGFGLTGLVHWLPDRRTATSTVAVTTG